MLATFCRKFYKQNISNIFKNSTEYFFSEIGISKHFENRSKIWKTTKFDSSPSLNFERILSFWSFQKKNRTDFLWATRILVYRRTLCASINPKMAKILSFSTLGDLVKNKKSLISVPDTATVQDMLKVLQQEGLAAVAVAAPPGKWLGAGASSVVEGGLHYIGFVSAMDLVLHLGEGEYALKKALSMPVTNLIGHSNEGMSLWVMAPDALLLETMEPMSKGVHRVLVPFSDDDGQTRKLRLLSQTDIIRFLLQNLDELGPETAATVQSLGLVNPNQPLISVGPTTSVLEACRVMRNAGVNAVAVVIREGEGGDVGRLVGTLSASDFRGIDEGMLEKLPGMQVMEFLKEMSGVGVVRPPIACRPTSPLAEVMANAILTKIHRVWITDENGIAIGVVTFTDIIGVIRAYFMKNMSG